MGNSSILWLNTNLSRSSSARLARPRIDANPNVMIKAVLKGLWQFVSFLFVPQRRPKDD